MTDDALLDSLKAIAHPSRLRILQELAKGELNVGEIEQATEIGQPTLSQQLAVLRKAGLVDTRRQAKLVYYSLEQSMLGLVTETLGSLVPDAGKADDSGARRRAQGAANFARMAI
ncbi:metalloregulator ArsR/SmtB family transcription factor [Aurantiacibacter sp. MUD11]|uniref:ArsR/SmtB family transcription factor n=1 Tax=Aurantiacibacter sp. MUD11 TaxID=3003265 RepID=UPI0022AA0D2A|nr:metalloregulator ArsR/SmtB family transcription factor [Aurantiacibacter sp. MUD11]WAT16697.1 metalloregulator ArsR/SmtB family transcription factor [Aurantiacibacter sp. MUD11]